MSRTGKKRMQLALRHPEVSRPFIEELAVELCEASPEFADVTVENFAKHEERILASVDEAIRITEGQIADIDQWIEDAQPIAGMIRRLEHEIEEALNPKQEAKQIEIKEVKRTKAAGKVCSRPHCNKDATVWDEKGKGWCKRDAPKKLRQTATKEERKDA